MSEAMLAYEHSFDLDVSPPYVPFSFNVLVWVLRGVYFLRQRHIRTQMRQRGARIHTGLWCQALPSLVTPFGRKLPGMSGVASVAAKVLQPENRNMAGASLSTSGE